MVQIIIIIPLSEPHGVRTVKHDRSPLNGIQTTALEEGIQFLLFYITALHMLLLLLLLSLHVILY